MVTLKSFLPTVSSRRPVILGVSAALMCVNREYQCTHSVYTASKIAQAHMLSTVRTENPHIFIACYHPGIIRTNMLYDMSVSPSIPVDDGK